MGILKSANPDYSMKQTNKNISAIVILVAVWIVLATLFAFADLQISQALFNPTSGWAHFIEAYGQIPGELVAFASGSLLLRLFKAEKNVKNFASLAGVVTLVVIAAGAILVDAFGAQIGAPLNFPLIGGMTVVMVFLAQLILRGISASSLDQYKPVARIGLALWFIAALLTVWVFKISWGRWTYRDIVAAGNLSLFTPWYLPQGYDGHFSFFSGHAAMSMSVLPLTLLAKRRSLAKIFILALIILWGLVGTLSRVVIGAHFASDVLFGAGETILWFLLLSKRYNAKIG